MQSNQIGRTLDRFNDLLQPTWRLRIGIGLIVLLIVVIIGDWFFGWHVTGFFAYTAIVPNSAEIQSIYYPGKTLWDVFDLLLFPAVVVGGTVLLAWVYRQTQFAIAADHQAQADVLSERDRDQRARIAQRQREDTYLQQYFAFMTDLLLHRSLRRAKPDLDVAQVARLRTVSSLANLGQDHRKEILRFLYEAGLIHVENTVISLAGVDLAQAELSAITLKEANLQGVNLAKANLQQADLTGAYLEGANLTDVNLLEADLEGATYDQATIWPVDFNPNSD